jgi:hypothetical protein
MLKVPSPLSSDARLRAGLLLNFNVAILPDGMSRKVL